MKPLSKAELAKAAEKTFKDHPEVESVFLTEDGQVFLKENQAWGHARKINLQEPKTFEVKNEKLDADSKKEAKAAEQKLKAAEKKAAEIEEKALAAQEKAFNAAKKEGKTDDDAKLDGEIAYEQTKKELTEASEE